LNWAIQPHGLGVPAVYRAVLRLGCRVAPQGVAGQIPRSFAFPAPATPLGNTP
jgi:hypothetical protein